MKESISALMDAQLSEPERLRLLTELSHDHELRKTWERYHIIRAALSKDLGPVISAELGDRIATHVHELPPPTGTRVTWIRDWRPVVRWAGSLALAASVAAVAILGVQWFVSDDRQGAPQQVAARSDQQGSYVRAGIRWVPVEPEVGRILNTYLVEHHEFTPTSSMNGVMSYGRFVVYDNSP